MIMFWNQKEIYMGNSMQKFSEVRTVLGANKIKYKYKVVSLNQGFTRGRTGMSGVNMEFSYIYYIYVHKDNYNSACGLLRNTY